MSVVLVLSTAPLSAPVISPMNVKGFWGTIPRPFLILLSLGAEILAIPLLSPLPEPHRSRSFPVLLSVRYPGLGVVAAL